jgi:hypothetical protein
MHGRRQWRRLLRHGRSFWLRSRALQISRKIGEERLFPAIEATRESTVIAVAGVSCRQQIEHFTDRKTKHIAEVLAERIAPGHVWQAPRTTARPDVESTQDDEAHGLAG